MHIQMGSPRSSVQTLWGVCTVPAGKTTLNIVLRYDAGTLTAMVVEWSGAPTRPHHQELL